MGSGALALAAREFVHRAHQPGGAEGQAGVVELRGSVEGAGVSDHPREIVGDIPVRQLFALERTDDRSVSPEGLGPGFKQIGMQAEVAVVEEPASSRNGYPSFTRS